MKVTLNSGYSMPKAIYGTGNIKKQEVKPALFAALSAGYTHIDTAASYGNESEIGEALSDAFSSGLTSRDSLFISTKAWPSKYRNIKQACLNSLQRLKLDYLDLYLLHWPLALQPDENEPPVIIPGKNSPDKFPLYKVWTQMEQLVDEGLVRSIGISNWTIGLLNDLLGYARILPAAHQFESHVYNQRKELVEFCLENEIVPVAYRLVFRPPDSAFFPFQLCALDHPVIVELGMKYAKTPAQVVIQWTISKGCAYAVKSAQPSRIRENYDAQFFEIEKSDLEEIEKIPFGGVYIDPYLRFGIHLFC